ncbi:MAG: helix-turn-helix transcriptional regulator [Verrucomicrobia bacterium]|nr:helix-turn-helix transcriptional regulator [Verrucomicrobiota bacterium]
MSRPHSKFRLTAPKSLPPGALELVAARFRLLAEPMRLRLLHELRGGEKSVTALVEATGAGQANVSKHLSLLAGAGMVGRRKQGLNVHYFIADESLFELCDLVCGRLQEELAAKTAWLAGSAGRETPSPSPSRRP